MILNNNVKKFYTFSTSKLNPYWICLFIFCKSERTTRNLSNINLSLNMISSVKFLRLVQQLIKSSSVRHCIPRVSNIVELMI